MARFDVYLLNSALVLDLQNDLIEIPGSRVVAPLLKAEEVPQAAKGLHPAIVIADQTYVMATHLLAAAPASILKKTSFNVAGHRDDITRALDLLFQGY